MSYRFSCRYCKSRFSLEQQLEVHEKECAQVTIQEEEKPSRDAAEIRRCKHCGQRFKNLGQYTAHKWSAHREAVLAEQERKRESREVDERKMDAAIGGNGHGAGPPSRPPRPSAATPAPADSVNRATCPMCGGVLAATTAELVRELAGVGISEEQAFRAARIARRVLGIGEMAR